MTKKWPNFNKKWPKNDQIFDIKNKTEKNDQKMTSRKSINFSFQLNLRIGNCDIWDLSREDYVSRNPNIILI